MFVAPGIFAASMFTISNDMLMWSVGRAIFTRQINFGFAGSDEPETGVKPRFSLKLLVNANLIGVLLGCSLLALESIRPATGSGTPWPESAACAVACVIYHRRHAGTFDFKNLRRYSPTLLIVLTKLLLVPLLFALVLSRLWPVMSVSTLNADHRHSHTTFQPVWLRQPPMELMHNTSRLHDGDDAGQHGYSAAGCIYYWLSVIDCISSIAEIKSKIQQSRATASLACASRRAATRSRCDFRSVGQTRRLKLGKKSTDENLEPFVDGFCIGLAGESQHSQALDFRWREAVTDQIIQEKKSCNS
jgi:hypothetical protein